MTDRWLDKIHVGDARVLMRQMIADGVKVQTICTSPPYWQLRDYGIEGQYGLERTPERHLARLRSTFRLCRELLADDGTLWLNYRDSYNSGTAGPRKPSSAGKHGYWNNPRIQRRVNAAALKPKDLIGMPWMLAFVLRADRWWLRSCIVRENETAMPESTKDRPTLAHEYVFLLSRAKRYYYDGEAIAEPRASDTNARYARARNGGYAPPGQEPHRGFAVAARERRADPPVSGHAHGPGDHDILKHARWDKGDRKVFRGQGKYADGAAFSPDGKPNAQSGNRDPDGDTRNARSVWRFPSEPFYGPHFAVMPRELARRCILAGSRPGDVVFDCFAGTGTTCEIALSLGRHYIGIELNPTTAALFRSHRSQQTGLHL